MNAATLRLAFLTGGCCRFAACNIAGNRCSKVFCCCSLWGNNTPLALIEMLALMLYSEYQYESHVASIHV